MTISPMITAILYFVVALGVIALLGVMTLGVRRILRDFSETIGHKKCVRVLTLLTESCFVVATVVVILFVSRQYYQYKNMDANIAAEAKAQKNALEEAQNSGILVSFVHGFAITDNRSDRPVIIGAEGVENGQSVIFFHKVPAHINSVYNLITEKDEKSVSSESAFIDANKTLPVVLIKNNEFRIAANRSNLPMVVETEENHMESAGKEVYYDKGPVDRLILAGDTYYR